MNTKYLGPTVLLIGIAILLLFTFDQSTGYPADQIKTEMNIEQQKEMDLQTLLGSWYKEAEKYQKTIDNCIKNNDAIGEATYRMKLESLNEKILDVAPIMQNYD